MAAQVMREKKDAAGDRRGADRIAANGEHGEQDRHLLRGDPGRCCHGVPFYVAAPSSTFNLSMKTGAAIPIEQRTTRAR